MTRRNFMLAVGFAALSLGMLTRPKVEEPEADWNHMLHLMMEDQRVRMKKEFPVGGEMYYLSGRLWHVKNRDTLTYEKWFSEA